MWKAADSTKTSIRKRPKLQCADRCPTHLILVLIRITARLHQDAFSSALSVPSSNAPREKIMSHITDSYVAARSLPLPELRRRRQGTSKSEHNSAPLEFSFNDTALGSRATLRVSSHLDDRRELKQPILFILHIAQPFTWPRMTTGVFTKFWLRIRSH